MVELGIYFPLNAIEVGDSRIKYILTTGSHYPNYQWPQWKKDKIMVWLDAYTEDAWGYYKTPAIYKKGLTNLAYVAWRFKEATERKNDYEYAMFLLGEEFYHPFTLIGGAYAAWRVNLNEWVIDGTADLGGQHLEALKPWYIRTKGAWNQTWWNSQVATNQPDATTKAWADEYYFKLHKAWVTHIHSIGKKAAIGALFYANPDQQSKISYYYGTPECFEYVVANYDLISQYTYPMCMPPTIPCVTGTFRDRPFEKYVNTTYLSWLRSKIKGLFVWNLTGLFTDGYGSGDKRLQFEEYKRVLPYVDVITCVPYNEYNSPTKELMVNRLLEFCSSTNSCPGSVPPCPPATLKMTIEPVVI